MAYLKRQNINDQDIFIRPYGATGLVFFDDFNRGMLDRLRVDGLVPAVVIQSSPLNFHGWIRVSDTPQDETLCTFACKVIAKRYGGDDGAAKWRQFGRLAGFTNRKPKYIDEAGHHPFVLLDETKTGVARNAEVLLSDAEALLNQAESERLARLDFYKNIVVDESLTDADSFFKNEMAGLYRRYGASLDNSKADWVIVNKMLKRGYGRLSIESALLTHSQHIADRKKHNAVNYVQITLDAALGLKIN